MKKLVIAFLTLFILAVSCKAPSKDSKKIRLVTLAPGHFHASLIQKNSLSEVDDRVYVYAPEGAELDSHLKLIDNYNKRPENSTSWEELVYTGEDYLQKMTAEQKGDVVVLAGNNKNKTNYIYEAIASGFNVLSDKPMVISSENFSLLEKAYQMAEEKNLLLLDMMTERYNIINIVQRELMKSNAVFGELVKGTEENPAIDSESIHYFLKTVSGAPLIRPAWYYDVEQQGDGIVDVTTHLIDLMMWKCFPDQPIDYEKDIVLNDAKRWATKLSLSDFTASTSLKEYPIFLNKYLSDTVLNVYSNGYMQFSIKGVQMRVKIEWKSKAAEAESDSHQSITKGTKADLLVLQGKEQNFKPKLYVRKNTTIEDALFRQNLEKALDALQDKIGQLSVKETEGRFEIIIPDELKTDHEFHFSQLTEEYLSFLRGKQVPEWELKNTLAKYYLTTEALKLAKRKNTEQ